MNNQAIINLKFKRLHPAAILPKYQSEGAACFDLHSLFDYSVSCGYSVPINTGWSVEVPEGHVLLIYSRSGHGFKNGVRLSNCVGVIDSDYRGELLVRLHKDSPDTFSVSKGDRIAQAMLVPIPKVSIIEAESLSETIRGEAGFGSTGSQ